MSMRTRAVFHLTVGGLLPGGAISAQAASLGFLNDMPLSWMKQRDVDSINAAVITGASTANDGDRTCRDMGVVLNAKGQSVSLRPQLCKQGSGAWQLQKKH